MTFKTVATLLLSLGVAVGLRAQEKPEYSLFMEAAGNQAVLYRGHQATSYANMRYNGHYYWETPLFRNGSVMLDGRLYTNVLLNVDSCERQLLACAAQGVPAIALNRDDVEWFEIEGNRFVNLYRQNRLEKVEEGFYMVIQEGRVPLYLIVDKALRTGPDNYNGVEGIGYDDPGYREDILTSFIRSAKYYTVKGGRLKKIGKRKVKSLLYE